MPFTLFRALETISAIYFDGGRDSALEILAAFPHEVAMELDKEGSVTLRVYNQAAFIKPHAWVYHYENRLSWRDHDELTKKWEQLGETKAPVKRTRTKRK